MDIFQNKHSIDTSLKYLKKFYINFSLLRMRILHSFFIIMTVKENNMNKIKHRNEGSLCIRLYGIL